MHMTYEYEFKKLSISTQSALKRQRLIYIYIYLMKRNNFFLTYTILYQPKLQLIRI